MVYTEIRNINGKRYYYRVLSVRKGNKVSKKRIYLGCGLLDSELLKKEKESDQILLLKKIDKNLKNIGKIKSKIVKILKENSVKRAGIFGSYARGEQRKNSDIDIAVEISDKSMSLVGFIRIIRLLEKALKRKVDLVEYDAIKPQMKEKVIREEIKII